MSEHAYIATYKGVQLGDECFMIAPGLEFEPAMVNRLFRSPIAAVHRPTSGKLYTYQLMVHLLRDNPIEVADQLDQWHELIDDEAGIVEIRQGIDEQTLVKTLDEAWLQDVQPDPRRSPAAARILPVTLVFVSPLRPT